MLKPFWAKGLPREWPLRLSAFCLAALAALSASPQLSAAVPELVGALDLALKDSSVKKLQLGASQREALLDIIDDRELEGAELALAVKDLPPAERLQRLAKFREETVELGLEVLDTEQREILTELRRASGEPAYAMPGEAPQTQAPEEAESPATEAAATQEGAPPTKTAPSSPATEAPVADKEAADSEQAQADESDPSPAAETAPEQAQLPATGRPSGRMAPRRAVPVRPEVQARPEVPARQPAQTVAEVAPESDEPERLTFNFRFQPWSEVLKWFAEKADLSLVLESPPPGTFNYQDNRSYTVGEALDVINSLLQVKGFTLVRKGRMLLLVNLEDEIPPNLVTDVPLEKLDERGEYELVRVLFRVRNMLPADAAEELEQMMGPQGSILVLRKAGMIQVTETAGRIRTMRSVIEAIEQPGGVDGAVREFVLEYATADEALPIVKQMLGISSEAMATPTGSLQLAVDPLGLKIFAQGSAVQLRRLKEVLDLVDVPGSAAGTGVTETPQLEVYPITTIDPELVLGVLQTILAGNEETRIATDAQTGNLVALATPTEHATIRATLSQMQQDSRKIEVIPLNTVDPSLAVLAINKLFTDPMAGDEPDPRAPLVDADLASRSLMVRASPDQILQIKDFLKQLGEGQAATATAAAGGNVRMLPISPSAARSALGQVEEIWPMLRPNRIRIVTPSAAIPEYKPSDREPEPETMDPLEQLLNPGAPFGISPGVSLDDRSASAKRKVKARFAAQAPQEPDAESEPESRPGAPIFVAPGPSGTLIASEDLEALDDFEQLLRNSAGQASSGGRQFAVFYLKYAEASAAAEILGQVFGSGGGDGGLMGDIAGAAFGGLGGGLVGDLLGLGGEESATGFASTSIDIVPDLRLNALVVYAQPADLDMVDQLLRVLDQSSGPEPVEAGGKARMIAVYNTSAAAVAEVVKEAFQDRMQGSGGGQQMDPQQIMRAMRRGMGGGGGGGGGEQEPAKMTIAVDTRSNSLVVRAPDPLFQQVQQLVRDLDEEGLGTPQSTRVVSVQHTNPAALKEALSSLLGEAAVTTTTNSPNATTPQSRQSGSNSNNAAQAREMMRGIEMMRQMQGGGGRGGPGGGMGGRGGPGGGTGGGMMGGRGGGGRGGPGGGRGGRGGGRGGR